MGAIGVGLAGCRGEPTVKEGGPATEPGQPKAGGTLRTVATNDPASFDMHQETSFQTLTVIGPLYNNLVQFKPGTMELEGDLAQNFELMADGTIVFHLRDNVRWHDGRPFVADDVVWNFQRMMSPPQGVRAPRRDWFDSVDRVEAVDAKTVRIVQKYPRASFLPSLAINWTVMLPPHAIARINESPIGTGPFRFVEYQRSVRIRYAKNQDYFKPGLPYLDGIEILITTDQRAQMEAFRTRQVDMLSPMSRLEPPLVKELQSALPSGAQVMSYDGWRWFATFFNTTRPPFNDRRVRYAIHLLLNRQEAIQVLEEGLGLIGSYLPPSSPWGVDERTIAGRPGFRPDKTTDVAEAKRLLEQAGITPGSPVRVEGITRGELYPRHPVWLADQLKSYGIEVQPLLLDSAEEQRRLDQKRFDIRTSANALQLPDPDNIVRYYVTGGGFNYGNYSNPQMDQLLQAQARELDETRRRSLVTQLISMLESEAPAPPTYWTTNFVFLHENVKNFRPGPGTYANNKYEDVWFS
jgi:peptide/nickel transport system substrate-binding protein